MSVVFVLFDGVIVPSAHKSAIKRKKRVGAEKSESINKYQNSVENDRNPKHNVANIKYHIRVLLIKCFPPEKNEKHMNTFNDTNNDVDFIPLFSFYNIHFPLFWHDSCEKTAHLHYYQSQ